jgi:hypothetical protein
MLRTYTFATSLLGLLLCACAGGPESYSHDDMDRLTARPKRLLSKEEMRGNCPGLTVALRVHVGRLKTLQSKANKEQEWPPPTLMAMWEERPVAADVAKERERIQELNAVLDAKGCKMLDIEEELRVAPLVGETKKAEPNHSNSK